VLALVGISALGHVIVSFSRPTVLFFPDEYLYSELSRSLSSSDLPLVRGTLMLFPSLLQPVITAPFWLIGSVETGFRASMVLDSIVMSLAALPVYWLGRRLGLSGWLALLASALALATPSMLYSSWLMGEAIAYPLFLAGFSMGVLALSGDRRWLIPTLAVCALASLARIQLLALPLALALAAALLAARERRFRSFFRARRYLIGGGFVLVIAALVLPASAFGFYKGIRHIDLEPGSLALHFFTQVVGLLFACGWIILPGALIGLGLTIYQPRSRIELSFACSAPVVTIGLLLQASLFGVTTIPQERYLFYSVPLLALCLALLIERGWPLRRTHALLMLPIPILVAVLPLSTYTVVERSAQSSFLIAVHEGLEPSLGLADTSLLVAVVVSVLALAALALPFAGRFGGITIFVAAIAFSATVLAISVNATENDSATLMRLLTPRGDWVDKRLNASGVRGARAVLLQGYSTRPATLTVLFWNRSVDRVALLPHSLRPDVLPWPALKIRSDGALSVDGKPLVGPLLVDNTLNTINLRGADRVARGADFTLWLPRGRPRFALYAYGFSAGAMRAQDTIALWPTTAGGRLAGFLTFRVRAIREIGAVKLSLSHRGTTKRLARVQPGETRRLRIAVCSSGPWRATITVDRWAMVGSLIMSAQASIPAWQEDATACAEAHSGAGG
jgi:hypothetical protein